MLKKLRQLLSRRRQEREFEDEVRAHLELLAEEYQRRGLSPAAAREAARREFGALEPMRERYRDQLAVPIVDTVVRDVRYGLRTLRRSPGFAAAAIASIALGIGVNCAVFAVLDAALLQSLRVAEPDRLAAIDVYRRQGRTDFSHPIFRDMAARQQALSGIAATGGVRFRQVRLEGAGDEIDNVDGSYVSVNYFSLLGVNAARGRVFTGDEGAVAVLGDGSGSGSLAAIRRPSDERWCSTARRSRSLASPRAASLATRSGRCAISGSPS
jgi:putative ABC transport system permease protein